MNMSIDKAMIRLLISILMVFLFASQAKPASAASSTRAMWTTADVRTWTRIDKLDTLYPWWFKTKNPCRATDLQPDIAWIRDRIKRANGPKRSISFLSGLYNVYQDASGQCTAGKSIDNYTYKRLHRHATITGRPLLIDKTTLEDEGFKARTAIALLEWNQTEYRKKWTGSVAARNDAVDLPVFAFKRLRARIAELKLGTTDRLVVTTMLSELESRMDDDRNTAYTQRASSARLFTAISAVLRDHQRANA